MRLSLRAIEICRRFFGKGDFLGFDLEDENLLEGITDTEVGQDFDELTESEILEISGEDIRISALGQHILNMMIMPEQFIYIRNEADGICTRVYLKNAYYIYISEDLSVTAGDDYNRFRLELLPSIDLVVGAFVSSLHRAVYSQTKENALQESFTIAGMDFDKSGKTLSELSINGHYEMENVIMTSQCDEGEKKEDRCDVSTLINSITEWLFDRIAKAYEREEK